MYLLYIALFSFIGFLMFFDVDGESSSPKSKATVIGDTKKSTDNVNIINNGFDPNSYYTPILLKDIEKKVNDFKINQNKVKKQENQNKIPKTNSKVDNVNKNSNRVNSYLQKCNSRKGKFTLSHYNNNGGDGRGITASGKPTQHGFTASNNVLYGKKIKITLSNGTVMYRTVHDRGSEKHMGYGNCKVDIYVNTSTKEIMKLGLKKEASIEVLD
jgi:hypothetical protein